MSEFHSLSTLIKRLEVATTRLEDLALSGMSASTIAASNPPAAPSASSAQPKEAPVELPRAVEAFNSTVDAPVKQFIELSNQLGGPVQEQVRIDKPMLTRQFFVDRCILTYVYISFSRLNSYKSSSTPSAILSI